MVNAISKNLLSFIKNSPSSFHCVASIKKILNREGFIELYENEDFKIIRGGKYYVTRNESSIIAFNVGEVLDNYSFNVVASHSDCPSFKVKPNSDIYVNGYHKINVEAYGGMLCSTWFDKPLSLAGRVIVEEDDKLVSKLIDFDKNLLSLPSVPIHFNRQANENATYSLANDMFPTIGIENISLKEIIAKKIEVDSDKIINYDLYLYPHQDGYFWGNNDEFIASFKLDDLQCAYTTLMGFIRSNNTHNVSVYCCFDNEEVGSTTRQGANSTFLEDTLKKISYGLNKNENQHINALATSMMISADNAHAIHPNHSELYDMQNNVKINEGIVIKFNAAQSYTSDSISSSIFQKICKNANVPYQFYTNKSGIRGGGTLGNISATHVSILSVDIGLAQLAMHSSCESSGTLDNEYMASAIKEFFSSYISLDNHNYSVKK
ncbi:MAG: M18 family aminopeptidase [Erysipelotrichaceae bacterium]|nr:M18 family aminopeptidase [Erysipelotrichaceae bacterium]